MAGHFTNDMTNCQRVFLGEGYMDVTGISYLRNYALRGAYEGFEGLQSVAADTIYSVSHNVGWKPAIAILELVCVTPDNGYIPGDSIYFSPWVDKLNAGFQFLEGPTVNSKTGGGTAASLTLTKWKWKMRIFKGW